MMRGRAVLGLGGGVIAAVLLVVPAVDALSDLWAARQQRATLAARLAAPPEPERPLVAAGLAIPAPDRASAARSLSARLRGSAASAGVLVETLTPTAPQPGIVALGMRLSGPEKAVIAWVDGIERGSPLTRFRSWRVSALADGGVRVEGEVVAAWH
ncbi:MAG: hypothetical protein ACK4GG_03345 [Sphingomonas sp.]